MQPKNLRIIIAFAAAIITSLAGIVVLIGWQLNSTFLKTFGLGAVTMKPNTAALFFLSGIALIGLQRPNRSTNLIVRFLLLVIILIGTLSLCQNFFGWDIGLGEFLFREPSVTIGTSHPGLMAPNTALNFMLIGFAFILFTFNRFRQTSLMEFTILFPLTVSVIGLFGYLTGLEELAGPAAYTQMATNTAVTFTFLCLGLLFTVAEKQHKPVTIEQQLFAGLTASVTIILFISLLSISGIQSLRVASGWVEHTQQVKNQLGNILSNVLEIQSGGRGYLLTGNEKFLLPRKEAEVNLPSLIKKLYVLIADNKEQIQKLAALETLVKQRIAFSDEVVSAMRLKGKSEANLLIATEKGNDDNNIHELINTMISTEDRLLQLRNKAVNGQTIRTQIIIFLSLFIQTLLLAFIFLFVKKDVAGRRKAEEKLSLMNEELEGRVKERTAEITKLNRIYTVLSNVNQTIVRVTDKQKLFDEVCRIAVDDGKFWMAWIGMVDEQTNKIMPIASSGQAEEYIKTINIDLSDKIIGEGLIGRSIKTGVHFLTNDLINDPELIPWREKVSQLGCKSAASFPINVFGKTIGAFMLYSNEQFFFDEVEVKLIDELALDISFAVESIENENKRRLTEEAILASRAKLDAALNSMTDAVFISDADGQFTEFNDAFATFHKFKNRSECATWLTEYHDILDVFMANGEIAPLEMWAVPRALRGEIGTNVEYKLRRKDIGETWIGSYSFSPIRDKDGVIIGSVVAGRDITESKLNEEKLHQANERFSRLVSSLNDVVWTASSDGLELVGVNNSFESVYGISIDEFKANPKLWIEIVHPEDTIIAEASDKELFEKGYTQAEYRIVKPDGSVVWLLDRKSLIYDETGKAVQMGGIAKDITEQKNAEKLIITQRDLGLEINSITNLDELYSISIDALRHATGMECGRIYMFDKEERNLDLIYSVGLSEQFCEATSHYDEHSDNVKFVKTGNPAFIEYAQLPVKLGDIEKKENLQSFILLPLINKEKVVGCINLVSRKHIAISIQQQKGVETIVVLVANALERIRNEEEILNMNASLEIKVEERTGQLAETNKKLQEEIEERVHAETEIKKARLEAERANLAKSEFLSRMSHELRTPMNSILGFAQLMDMGELTPNHKKGVDHILKSGKHLLDLINEVLDLSRIEAGELSISLEPVPLRGIVSETMDVIKPLATTKNITFESPESPVCDLFVKADRQKLQQVLLNLLSNAVKYNREGGGVRVECEIQQIVETRLIASLQSPAASRPTVRISVTDTGKGIAPEYMERLFNPFERVGAEISEVEGTGLGLAVSKKLIEAMNGTIGVESEPGVGSTFWIDLPQSQGQIDRHERKGGFNKPEDESVVTGKLLYIEDNVSNIQLVEQILKMHRPQINLITEMYGKRTLKLAADFHPDLVLLDLDLPDMHGSEVLTLLQKDEITKSIPVVIISADAHDTQVEKLMQSGAKNYLTKPIDVLELLRVVDEVMRK